MTIAEIMVLPPIENGRPQMLLNDQGIWRDLTPSPDTLDRESFRKSVEAFLLSAMTSVAAGNPVNAKGTGFIKECRKFYRDLLPTDLQKELARIAGLPGATLRIYLHRSGEWVPWELLHDGTDYLGLRMHVVRLPLMARTDHMRGKVQQDVSRVFNLLGRNILDDALVPQWQQTFAPFTNGAGQWETRCPKDPVPVTFASWDDLEAARDAQIIHVTCHGGLRDDDKSPYYWSFDIHGDAFSSRITVDDLKMLELSQQPLVFGNACASAGGGPAANNGGLHGLGAAFMASGALNFVGTVAPITQKASLEFAAAFYQNLFDPAQARTIAEALQVTKLASANANDPSYLFYCLYGPPEIKYRAVH